MGPKSGKGATLATRITAATRAALDEEAGRSGRSVSQVAEIWLDEARNGRAALKDLVGGYDMVPVFEKLGMIASAVKVAVPDPQARRVALQSALALALTFVLPQTPSPVFRQLEDDTERLKGLCATILEEIEAAGEGSAVYEAALRPVEEFMEGVPGSLLGRLRSGATVALIVRSACETGARIDLKRALEKLSASGAGASVSEAISICDALERLTLELSFATREAAETGIRVAQKTLGIPWSPRVAP